MNKKIVAVIGGSGFLGRYVVNELVKSGYLVKVLCRTIETAEDLKTIGPSGIVSVCPTDSANFLELVENLRGAYAVINLVGILYESGKQKFSQFHVKNSINAAMAAEELKIEHFVQVSALGVDKSFQSSHYARSKLDAEKQVKSVFKNAVIIRPSVLFGAEDNFFNKFAFMSKFLKIIPSISGYTKFQPIYVADVAKAIVLAIDNPVLEGKIIELAGDKVYSFNQLLVLVKKYTNSSAIIVPIPKWLAYIIALVIAPFSKAITIDQLNLLKYDNIIDKSNKHLTAKDLHLKLHSIEDVVPKYLSKFSC
jgi:uncharacterized protein YbjT (DUF2867 family)